MANCQELFSSFQETVKLSQGKANELRTGRNALRQRIRGHFHDELGMTIPRFRMQGSFAMHTVVTPMSGDYDLDDGVYLWDMPADKSDWPSATTVHGWIAEAVSGQTNAGVEDKPKCVRVQYSTGYHIDLPTYILTDEGPYLACMPNGSVWELSDAGKLVDWFRSEVARHGDQLRRVVRLLKAWSQVAFAEPERPKGLLLTILAVDAFKPYGGRDDSAFGHAISAIRERLDTSREVRNPVEQTEQMGHVFAHQLDSLAAWLPSAQAYCHQALTERSRRQACVIWRQEVFGKRFPSCDNVEDVIEPERRKSFTVLGRDDKRSAVFRA